MEERYIFRPGDPLLERTKRSLEYHGYTCTIEYSETAGHELDTLICTPKERPNRAERGCNV